MTKKERVRQSLTKLEFVETMGELLENHPTLIYAVSNTREGRVYVMDTKHYNHSHWLRYHRNECRVEILIERDNECVTRYYEDFRVFGIKDCCQIVRYLELDVY